MTAYLAGVQERLRAAELARVEADARAEEERKRRKLALALAAAVLALMAVGGTGAAVYWQQRRDQAARLELALREVTCCAARPRPTRRAIRRSGRRPSRRPSEPGICWGR